MPIEYIAIPAPSQTKPARGNKQKNAVDRLASAMTERINEMAAQGWEYMRTETLTVEDKPHRLSKIVERIETVMIFKRLVDERAEAPSEPDISEDDVGVAGAEENRALGGVTRD